MNRAITILSVATVGTLVGWGLAPAEAVTPPRLVVEATYTSPSVRLADRQSATVRFTAKAGEIVGLDVAPKSGQLFPPDVTLRKRGVGEVALLATRVCGTNPIARIPSDGDYEFRYSPGGSSGPHRLTLNRARTRTMTPSTPAVTIPLTRPGSFAAITNSLPDPGRIVIGADSNLDEPPTTPFPKPDLTDIGVEHDGVLEHSGSINNDDEQALDTTGDGYHREGDDPGRYTYYYSPCAGSATVTFDVGSPEVMTAELDGPGVDVDTSTGTEYELRFAGTAGQLVYLEAVTPYDGSAPQTWTRGPDGQSVPAGPGGVVELPATGTYSMLFAKRTDPQTVRLRTPVEGDLTVGDPVKLIRFADPGRMVLLHTSGVAAGDQLKFFSSTVPPSPTMFVETGTLTRTSTSLHGAWRDLTLVGGTTAIALGPGGDQTGQVKVRIRRP